MQKPELVRNWMKIQTRAIEVTPFVSFRSPSIGDAPLLGALMDHAYRGTIDHEGETPEQCVEEMRGTLTGKYGPFLDFASFIVEEEGKILSASLITLWKERPLVAFSMSDPSAQGRGLAGFLIERSIDALAKRGYPELYLVVTQGNDRAERLYRTLGFEMIGPAFSKQPSPAT